MAEAVQPQWDSPGFIAMRQSVMARFNCSEEDAITRLQDLWNNADVPRPPTPPLPQLPPPLPLQEPAPPPDIEAPPPGRKKVTFTDFELDTTIPESLAYFPAQFAMDKIKSMEYTELWYFTTEGIMDASKITPTAADDTFGLLPTHGGLALQQIKASRASRNVIGDEALTWDQITTARHHFITAAAGWPDKHRMAMAEFFMNLESLKASGSCPRTLIAYQATARRRWHATLKGIGQPFNISNISKPLLLTLQNQIRDHDHQELKQAQNRDREDLKQARTSPPNLH